jgi:protein-disulfide isomerase
VTLHVPVTDLDHAEGSADAAVVLVMYGDYECPYCRGVFMVVKRLQKTLGARLRFVFRNFPMTEEHPRAWHAAAAAEAAALQGEFWGMHEALYRHQHRLDDKGLLISADLLGLDSRKFLDGMKSVEVETRIATDLHGALESGVNEPPALFIQGVRYSGLRSYAALLHALEHRT